MAGDKYRGKAGLGLLPHATGACRDGWMQDVADLSPQTDTALASSLLDYSIAQVPRAPEPRRSRYCHNPAAP